VSRKSYKKANQNSTDSSGVSFKKNSSLGTKFAQYWTVDTPLRTKAVKRLSLARIPSRKVVRSWLPNLSNRQRVSLVQKRPESKFDWWPCESDASCLFVCWLCDRVWYDLCTWLCRAIVIHCWVDCFWTSINDGSGRVLSWWSWSTGTSEVLRLLLAVWRQYIVFVSTNWRSRTCILIFFLPFPLPHFQKKTCHCTSERVPKIHDTTSTRLMRHGY
jgi:hypothetical protein